ncbi:MAG: TauD/TfdA family dioxygenase [Candidatus Puniceispirillum sp.]
MNAILEIETNLLPPEQVPAAPFAFPQAWNRGNVSKSDYFFALTADCLDELRAIGDDIANAPLPYLILTPDMYALDHCRAFIAKVKTALEDGVGFAIIDRLPLEDYPRHAIEAMYWILGKLLGRPVAQSFSGKMMYEVRDRGTPIGIGTRGSHTNAELRFHTDCSSNVAPPDYVGLLCIRPAMEGGRSQLTNWYEVYNRLLEKRPDLCARGFQPMLFDRQMEHADGDPRLLSRPPFAFDGRITVRYSERLNLQAYDMIGEKMDDAGAEMLAEIAEILKDPDIRVDLDFQPGQIQWINNCSIGHRRTSYLDDPNDPENKRTLWRLWLRENGALGYLG